ncbi:MAG: acetyl-CoA carboxylase biotin carboxyl carrier protein [Firmicutes bacterium]|nr:acetyl-CoA carboxylase biotin carboxyl carrier protein [Bacillota bacterium]
MKIDELVKLIEAVRTSNYDEFTLETGDVKLTLRRGGKVEVASAPVSAPAPAPETPSSNPAPATPAPVEQPREEGLIEVTAPMVGTFYRAPAPDADPFVEPGTVVKPGDTLCILEAMKLMNEIQAETGGEVVEVAVENGELVEFGQLLFTLRPTK